MSTNSLVISEVDYDNTSVRPIVCKFLHVSAVLFIKVAYFKGNFQNGKIPEGFEEHMVSQVYRDPDNELLVAVAANKQLYTANITQNKTHNTFIAIPNSKGTKVW